MNLNKSLQNIRLGWLPFIVIAVTTIAVIAISIYCLLSGWSIIFQNLFYFPIIIACAYYKKKGFAFSVFLSFIYLFLVIAFTRDSAVITQALIRVLIFVGIAGVVTFLSLKLKRVGHQLRKRTKELQAFHNLAEITEREGTSSIKLYQKFANILPQSWQYPEIACARIVIGDSEFCTENFTESPWKQSAPVKVHASVAGRIEVGYLEERPEEDEGPFLKEERVFIDAIAERIGRITERNQMEEALQKSEAKYRELFEASRDAIMTLFPPDWKFTSANAATVELFGVGDERRFTSLGPWDVSPERQPDGEASADKARRMIGTAMERGSHFFEWTHQRLNGEVFPATVLLTRVELEGKAGVQATVRDVTELKRAADQVQRYAAELERRNEEVKNFAYIVSHDLRVHLVNLKGYASELRSAMEVIGSNFDTALPHLNDEKRSAVATALHEDMPEALEFIATSVSRMDSFINAVLILARLGRQDLKAEPIDMNALVQTTVETMSHQLQERGITVTIGSLPHVVADRTSMEQIMGNILSNAVKYLDSSRPGRIEVTAKGNGSETIFFIRDNGRGITEEDMGKVFAPFRRAGKQDTPGEGMGLAYVQTLIRRHGGHISCESEFGKGTTFTFAILAPTSPAQQGACDA